MKYKGAIALIALVASAIAQAPYENARVKASSSSVPETLMIANLTNFAIMRSADNLARENIMQKATVKVEHDGSRPNAYLALEKVRQDPELLAALARFLINLQGYVNQGLEDTQLGLTLSLRLCNKSQARRLPSDSINERESGCSAALEKAFRDRIAIPLPGTCSGR